jgi:hypothetical protein
MNLLSLFMVLHFGGAGAELQFGFGSDAGIELTVDMQTMAQNDVI